MADVTKVEVASRLRLFRDNKVVYDQPFSMAATTYVEHTADRVILATNMAVPQEYNLGGVGTGKYFMATSDGPILVALDNSANTWTLGIAPDGGVVTAISAFTHVYFQNQSTTNTVTVDVVVSDKSA